jgi:hypothetical protein
MSPNDMVSSREWALNAGGEAGIAMRSLSNLTIIMLATVTLGAAAGYASHRLTTIINLLNK